MSKVRKTVIVDESVWYELKLEAFRGGLSLSKYLGRILNDRAGHRSGVAEVRWDAPLIKPNLEAEWSDDGGDLKREIEANSKIITKGSSAEEALDKKIQEANYDHKEMKVEVPVENTKGSEKKSDSEILAEAQKKLDETREKLERRKGESNAAWQIRKRVFERGAK